ncbi:hypothetical protein BTA51_25930 [Hahella sp. CCB-MM4]|uniref:tyrosine-type recombinase/integrase n=1 Tax=Hahella sp. (strain CCB-MM4) TaxID=1926491 RepID=UPI000B9B4408|nr:site-specific integrase [Hahella sp. CCB-MM4]OZG70410.1 hypothetical protein BTA51_25930 [Hahella sp. CCB-MM4]
METLRPLIDISGGTARYLVELPCFKPGHNLSPQNGLHASNDWDALLKFLNLDGHSASTLRSYSTALEQLSLWIILVRQVPLSGLTRADLAAYYEFISSPPEHWAGPPRKKFNKDGSINAAWRPFQLPATGKIGMASGTIKRVQRILKAFYAYMVDEGYLLGSPYVAPSIRGIRSPPPKKKSNVRFLGERDTLFIEKTLRDSLYDAKRLRNKRSYFKALRCYFVFELFLHTGLRISEAVTCRMGDINVNRVGKNRVFSMEVFERGLVYGNTRKVSLSESFIQILKEFRVGLNEVVSSSDWQLMAPMPTYGDPMPLIPTISGRKPVTARQISTIFNEIRQTCVETIDRLNEERLSEDQQHELRQMRSTLSRFTCHWVRHTYATRLLLHTGNVPFIQEQLGYAIPTTVQVIFNTMKKLGDGDQADMRTTPREK